MSRQTRALVYALGAVLLWSTVATGFKLGLRVFAPLQLVMLGVWASAILFAGVSLARGGFRLSWPLLREAALLGVMNPVVYYAVLFEAYDRLPAQIAQPLNYTWAITLALLAVPMLGQRLDRRTGAGILVSYAGVAVLLTGGSWDGMASLDLVGVALALGSTLIWASYWLLSARSTTDGVALLTLSFSMAAPIVTLVCALVEGLPAWGADAVFYGGWVGLLEMGLTFLLWQHALRLSDNAARTGQLIFLSPFISLLLIGEVVGETIQPTSVLGLMLIVAGLIVGRVSR